MSRLRRYLHSVASGYVLIAANAFYTFASIPLALNYLGNERYGVWALIMQVSQIISFVEFGMTPSITRILVDYKDRRGTADYGRMISTSGLIFTVQGVLIFLAGVAVSRFPGLFRIPEPLVAEYRTVLLGQFALHAASFATRVFGTVVEAHQRQYVVNYATVLSFAAAYVVLYRAFAMGLGLYSMLLANAVAWLVLAIVPAVSCFALGLLPPRGAWAGPSRKVFGELFRLGRGIFAVTIGSQIIMSAQPLVISRVLGLEATATWAVCTRPFFMVGLMLWRFFDYSLPAFAEMMARGERERLFARFKTLVGITAGLSAVSAVLLAVGNGPFVALWTGGRVSWPAGNDLLLGVWLFVLSIFHCHGMLVLTTKRLGWMPYVYLLDGVLMVVGAVLLSGRFGLGSILLISILCNVALHGAYGFVRSSRYFGIPLREVAWGWSRRALGVLAGLGLTACGAHRLLGGLPPWLYLVSMGGLLGGAGLLLLWALFRKSGMNREPW